MTAMTATTHPMPRQRQRKRRRPPRQPPANRPHRHTGACRSVARPAEQGLEACKEHDDLEVDPPGKESHRRRQRASTTTHSTAAEPVTSAVLLARRCHEPASRLALEVAGVQRGAASRTTQSPGRIGKRLINDDERSKDYTVWTGLVPHSPPPLSSQTRRWAPSGAFTSSSRGFLYRPPKKLDQKSAVAPPASCGCSGGRLFFRVRRHARGEDRSLVHPVVGSAVGPKPEPVLRGRRPWRPLGGQDPRIPDLPDRAPAPIDAISKHHTASKASPLLHGILGS